MWYSGNPQRVMYSLCGLEIWVNGGLCVVHHYFGIVISTVPVDCKERYLPEVLSDVVVTFPEYAKYYTMVKVNSNI